MTGRAIVPFAAPSEPAAQAPEPPHNIEAEQALLAALMLRPDQLPEVAQWVRPEHFYFADHQDVFACIEALVAANVEPTGVNIKGYLREPTIAGEPAHVYLARIMQEATGWSAASHARVVRDMATRRAMLAVGESLVERARFDPADTAAQAMIEDTEQKLLDLRAIVPQAHLAGQSAHEGMAWMRERITSLRGGLIASTAVSTGIADLDRVTNGGFQRGQLWLLAGRPGMGKTVAMTTLSRNAAREAGVLVFQLEVTRDQQWSRYLADLAYVHNRPLPFGRIMAGVDLEDDEVWRIDNAARRIEQLHLRLECEPSATVAQIAFAVKAEKRRLAKQGLSLGVVFIDYLKFVRVSDRYKGNRVLEIGEISGSLKQLAKAEDICIVLLAQLNRQVEAEGRADRRPTVADLRDSGELEQDADTVLLLYRESVYLERKLKASNDAETAARLIDRQHALELILGKNRSGKTCTLDLWCDVSASSIAQHSRGPQ